MDRLRAPAIIIQYQCSNCADGRRAVPALPDLGTASPIGPCRASACHLALRGQDRGLFRNREAGVRGEPAGRTRTRPARPARSARPPAPQPAEHRRDHHQDRQQDDGQDWRLSTDLCSRNMRPHAHRIARLFDIRYPASVFRPVNHASPVVAVAVVASDPARRPLRPPLIRRGCPSHVTRTT